MPLANSDMKAGRWAKRAKGRKLHARMVACWNAGGFVRVGTATRFTDYHPKHREMIRLGESGSLYVARGKHWDCADFCSIQFSA